VGEREFWLSMADSDVLLWARGVALHSGLDVEMGEPDVWPVQVQGPHSRDVMQELFGGAVMRLPYYFCTETDLDGIPVVVSPTGWTGEAGYEVYLGDSSRGGDLWERMLAAGEGVGRRPSAHCGGGRLGGAVGYAWGRSEAAWIGTTLQVGTPEGEATATVARLPFIDPGRRIPKS